MTSTSTGPTTRTPTMAIEQSAAGTPAGSAEITDLKMVIGGEIVAAAEGKTFEVVNPGNGKVIATAPLGGKEDVDRAVKAAQDAFDAPKGWSSFAAGKRGRTLAKFADLIKKSSEELAQLESRNTGKPIGGAPREITASGPGFFYVAQGATEGYRPTNPGAKPGPRPSPAHPARRR